MLVTHGYVACLTASREPVPYTAPCFARNGGELTGLALLQPGNKLLSFVSLQTPLHNTGRWVIRAFWASEPHHSVFSLQCKAAGVPGPVVSLTATKTTAVVQIKSEQV